MIGQTISHYKILEKLGEGGMGVVYKAQDLKLDRLVALKFLPQNVTPTEAEKKRFIHEAKAASSLDHPNICTMYEVDETPDGQMFLAMAFYEGAPLSEKIKQGPLKIDEAMTIVIQAAEGLQAAHEKGIIHRDIKSGNLMLTEKGQVKLMDFGLAKRGDLTMLTKTGATVGTVPYMSPEQARGEKVDHRTDIWSLGVVLYEIVAGRLPFQSAYSEAIVYSILNEEPPVLTSLRSNVPMELERIVKKAMQKDRANRYQRVEEMLVDLKSVRTQIESSISRPWVTTPALRTRRQLYLYGGIASLFVLIIAIGLYLFIGRGKPPEGKIMLAVLPFENLSGDPQQDYFSDGLTEEMISQLGRMYPQRLGVIARTSVTRYKRTEKGIDQIGRELGVDYILEGSVRRAADRVRITAQLIQVEDQTHLWAENYEREQRDLFALQTEVATRIGNSLAFELLPVQRGRLATARTINPQAHEAYLMGLSYIGRGKAGSEKSIGFLQQVIELQPDYAEAYAAMARAYNVLGFFGDMPPAEAYPKQKAAALKAIELDETLAETHGWLANALLIYDWNWGEAEKEFRRALELNPSHATIRHVYSHYLMAMGRGEESLAETRRAVELDPANASLTACLGWHCLFARLYDQAIEQSLNALAMDPNNYLALFNLGRAYEHRGKSEEATAAFQKAVEVSGGRVHALAGLAHAYAVAGKRQEAEKLLADLLARAKKSYVSAYELSAIYTALGDREQAFAWLDKAYEERSSWLVHVSWEPRFDALRSDPRFKDLLKRMGLEK